VDRTGAWRREVAFPAGAALAGFGKGSVVYGTIKEANGLRSVGRFTVK
jgi:hypothetical protein